MVHAAQPETAMTVGAMRMPNGYSHAPLQHVDNSVGAGWFTAKPDAFVVHDVVSRLSSVKAELPDECIPRAGPGLSEGSLPSVCDSFLVRRAQLVMTNAIDGRRPDWVPSPVITVERGAIVYARTRGGAYKLDKQRRRIVVMQAVRFVGDKPWTIARFRFVYGLWIEALDLVRVELRRRTLEGFDLVDELPPVAPWKSGGLTTASEI